MNVTVTDQEHCKKQVRLEIPSPAVRKEIDKVASDLSRRLRVDGFRPGHVPKSVILSRFKKELRDEVASQLLPTALGEAVKEKDLKVVAEPHLDELAFGDDESLNASFTISVAPEFELREYKAIPLTRPEYKVTEQDVEATIKDLRDKHAELVTVEDRPSAEGDIVSIRVKAESEPPERDEESDQDRSSSAKPIQIAERELEIEIGGKRVFPEFSAAVAGKRAADPLDFYVTYPENYSPESFAGRRIHYTGETAAVRKKQLPEFDDEFATTVDDETKTADALRARLRENLEHAAKRQSDSEVREAAKDALLDRNRFEVPEVMVEKQMDHYLESFMRQMAPYFERRKVDFDLAKARETQRARAEKDVRLAFILERIAVKENIQIPESEIDQEIERIAASAGKPAAAIRANLTKRNGLDSIREQAQNRKALELVIGSASFDIEERVGLPSEHEETD